MNLELIEIVLKNVGVLKGAMVAPELLFRKLGYLDPGSGSYLLQLLIGGLLGAIFVLRAYWSRVKGFFSRLLTSGKTSRENELD